MTMREGPHIFRECVGCKYLGQQSYRVQGDSGIDYWCNHPSRTDTNRNIGDTTCKTPQWCPFLELAATAAIAVWHRANAVEVPDVRAMIDHPGDTVSKFVAVSDGLALGRARWHYPSKSWCHKGTYAGEVLFWSPLPTWDGTTDKQPPGDAADFLRHQLRTLGHEPIA